MKKYNIQTKDRIKIKNMINIILNRDNETLPPILNDNLDEDCFTKNSKKI